jgi:hypothetical protein
VVDETDAEFERLEWGSSLAVGMVGIVAASFAVLPALVAFRLITFPAGWVGAALGCLGAAVSGVKLTAMAWALGARLSRRSRARAAVAYTS